MALRDELWAVSGEPHLEVEFDDSHPLAQGCISYGVLINGRPYDVKNRVWLQPTGTTGVAATQQGLAATTSSGSGDLWTAKFPSYSMTARNKASVWALLYSTVSNNTIKRAIRLAGPVYGTVLHIDLGDSANNYLAGGCGVSGSVYPRRNDTAAPAANTLHNVLFTRNSTTHGLYRNGVEVGDANPTTSTANFIDNINQVTLGNSTSTAPLQGGVIAWGAWDRDLSAADAALLYQDPRLLLRQRVDVPGAAGGSTLTATLIEATAGTDLASASAVLSASLLDAAAGTDITSAQPTVARSLVDAAGGVDLVNSGVVVSGTLVEGVSAVDLSSALATLSVTVNEAVTAAELLAATRIAHVAATEAAAGVDISSTGTSLSGSLVDAVVSADALSAAATLVASVTEVLAAAELLAAVLGSTEALARYTLIARARRLTVTAKPRRLEISK